MAHRHPVPHPSTAKHRRVAKANKVTDPYAPSRAKVTTPHAQTLKAAVHDLQQAPTAVRLPEPSYRPERSHHHPPLGMLFFFVVAVVAGIALAAVIFDLLVDAGWLQVPIVVPTNFFN